MKETGKAAPAKDKAAAIVTVFNAPNFTKAGAEKIAKWLEDQAKFIRGNHKELSKRFVARYLYR